MITFIHVRDSDQAVMGIGMIYYEDGTLDPNIQAVADKIGSIQAAILQHGQETCPSNCTARVVDTDEIPGGSGLNFDKTFYGFNEEDAQGNLVAEHRGWTDANPGQQIDVDVPVAKSMAHVFRRRKREEEFAPHDAVIAKQVPGQDAVAAEAARAEIRTRYDGIQTDIDNAADVDALKTVLINNSIL